MILRSVTISFVAGTLTALSAGAVRTYSMAADHLRQSLPVLVFFQPTLTDSEARQIFDQLRQSDADMVASQFVSAEEAAEEARKDPLLSRSMMLLNTNPFPASGEFVLSASSWRDGQEPSDRWGGIAGVGDVRWDRSRQQIMMGLMQIAHRYNLLLWVSAAFTLLWSLSGFYAFAKDGLDWGAFMPHLFCGVAGGAAASALFWFSRQNLSIEVSSFWVGALPVLPALHGSLMAIGLYRGRP